MGDPWHTPIVADNTTVPSMPLVVLYLSHFQELKKKMSLKHQFSYHNYNKIKVSSFLNMLALEVANSILSSIKTSKWSQERKPSGA